MSNWMGPWVSWRRDLAVAGLIGLFLGAVGPFGSFLNHGAALRMTYWIVMTVLAMTLFNAGVRWALHRSRMLPLPQWIVAAIATLVIAIPFSVLVAWCATTLWPEVARYVRPFDWYWQVVVLSLPIGLVWHRVSGGEQRPIDAAKPPKPDVAPMATLHDAVCGSDARVLCLQMEDHYVRVHTETGSRLVLSPLKAALQAVGEIEGLQVHRSWWVARHAVVRPLRSGRQLQLELINGVRAPVSRASVARLRAAGWLGVEGR